MKNMGFWNRKSALLAAVDDWLQRGLLDRETANALSDDIARQSPSRSFSSMILLLGAICLAFGIMTFVAANWDGMANLTRVGVLIGGLWTSWLASIYFKTIDLNWPAEVFVLLACAIFGASIMLISQIYHIQGEPKDGTWLWAMGTIGAALISRSVPALALGAILITIWAFMDISLFHNVPRVEYMYLVYWMICAVGAWWFSSRFVTHVLAIGLGAWWLVSSVQEFSHILRHAYSAEFAILLFTIAICSAFILLTLVLASHKKRNWFKGFEPTMLAYLSTFLFMMLIIWDSSLDAITEREQSIILQGYFVKLATMDFVALGGSILVLISSAIMAYRGSYPFKYDIIVSAIFAIVGISIFFTYLFTLPFVSETYFLAMSIWIIRMGMRLELRSVSILGFVAFGGVLLIIYFKTVGTLLDTSLFYLFAGAMLMAGAYFIPRFIRGSEQTGEAS